MCRSRVRGRVRPYFTYRGQAFLGFYSRSTVQVALPTVFAVLSTARHGCRLATELWTVLQSDWHCSTSCSVQQSNMLTSPDYSAARDLGYVRIVSEINQQKGVIAFQMSYRYRYISPPCMQHSFNFPLRN